MPAVVVYDLKTFMADENEPRDKNQVARREAWLSLRGILKDVYAEYGGGEAYLRQERENFYERDDEPSAD
jgi:hypothetical protein